MEGRTLVARGWLVVLAADCINLSSDEIQVHCFYHHHQQACIRLGAQAFFWSILIIREPRGGREREPVRLHDDGRMDERTGMFVILPRSVKAQQNGKTVSRQVSVCN